MVTNKNSLAYRMGSDSSILRINKRIVKLIVKNWHDYLLLITIVSTFIKVNQILTLSIYEKLLL